MIHAIIFYKRCVGIGIPALCNTHLDYIQLSKHTNDCLDLDINVDHKEYVVVYVDYNLLVRKPQAGDATQKTYTKAKLIKTFTLIHT